MNRKQRAMKTLKDQLDVYVMPVTPKTQTLLDAMLTWQLEDLAVLLGDTFVAGARMQKQSAAESQGADTGSSGASPPPTTQP